MKEILFVFLLMAGISGLAGAVAFFFVVNEKQNLLGKSKTQLFLYSAVLIFLLSAGLYFLLFSYLLLGVKN